MMGEMLDRLLEGDALSEQEAETIMDKLLTGDLGPERIAALVVALRAKGLTSTELVGFARAMRQHSHRIDAPGKLVLDNCGTGGAPRKSFNISTAAAFVIAAADITVAKHGNRSVTRPSGSADVLEAGGARLDLDPDQVASVLRKAGIGFLFAPSFHPAMRHAGPVRQALGIKTVFNLLGPLTNPAGATHQVLGVYDPELIPIMAQAMARLGGEGFVLHGEPGFDEATPCGPIHFARVQGGKASDVETVDPSALGATPCTPGDIAVAPQGKSFDLFLAVLTGEAPQPALETVALNAAFGLVAAGKEPDLRAGFAAAMGILRSGRGKDKWDAFLAAQQDLP